MKIFSRYMFFFLWLGASALVYCQEDENLVYILKKHNDAVNALAFTNDGKYLASGGEDRVINIWDVESGELVYSISNNYFPVKYMQFTGDNRILVASGPDVKLIDLQGNLIRAFSGYTTHIWSFEYNERTGRLVAGSFSKKINVWDFNTGTVTATLDGHEKSALAVCISPDGKYIVSGSLDETVRMWNASDGTELKKMDRHSGNILSVKFHPSGKYFASASLDKTIRLWDADSCSVLKTFTGHDKGVVDIAFSPDGYYLASASADKTVILWEVYTGNKLYSFVNHEDAVNTVRFSPDSKYLASGSADKTVMLWKLSKSIFAWYYFQDEIDDEISQSDFFGGKRKDETRQEYTEREEKARLMMNDLTEKYYQKYLKMRRDQIQSR